MLKDLALLALGAVGYIYAKHQGWIKEPTGGWFGGDHATGTSGGYTTQPVIVPGPAAPPAPPYPGLPAPVLA